MDGRPTWKQAIVVAALACTPPLAADRDGSLWGPGAPAGLAGLTAPAAAGWSAAPQRDAAPRRRSNVY